MNARTADLFEHPVFIEAVRDIEALGVKVYPGYVPGAKSYAVIGGRSNARWWLIPLENGRVAASGMALFQPILASARILKTVATLLCRLGLSRSWVRKMVYITGEPAAMDCFPADDRLSYAYFTGTHSPHRKITIQIMDISGNLKGFAKFTRNPLVARLLEHEAETLKILSTLAIRTTFVPRVLYSGDHGGGNLLITDTLKKSSTRSTTRFTSIHREFIEEMASKTAREPVTTGQLAVRFSDRLKGCQSCLDQAWVRRLDNAIGILERLPDMTLPASLSHGDFTPWNTFIVNDHLYVFDWEYAEQALPVSNDVIHFTLNEPKWRNQSAERKIEAVKSCVNESWLGLPGGSELTALVIYLLTQNLRQIERSTPHGDAVNDWDGAADSAAMFDSILATQKK